MILANGKNWVSDSSKGPRRSTLPRPRTIRLPLPVLNNARCPAAIVAAAGASPHAVFHAPVSRIRRRDAELRFYQVARLSGRLAGGAMILASGRPLPRIRVVSAKDGNPPLFARHKASRIRDRRPAFQVFSGSQHQFSTSSGLFTPPAYAPP